MSYIGQIPSAKLLTASDITDGVISTAKLADSSVTSAKITDGTIASGDLASGVGGKILQVVSLNNDQYATHSNTNVDAQATVLTQAITPSATNSKILLIGGVQVSVTSSSVQYYGLSLYRASTLIGEGDKSSWQSGVAEIHTGQSYKSYSTVDTKLQFQFVDSPNTTSSVTYNIKCWANYFSSSLSNLTLVVNGGGYNYNSKETAVGSSNLLLMEIGA